MGDGLITMISTAGTMEKAILILLAIASVALWSVVFLKIPELVEAKRNSRKFLERFHTVDSFSSMKADLEENEDCVHLRVFQAALAALKGRRVAAPPPTKRTEPSFQIQPENQTEELVLLNMQHTAANYFLHLQKGLSFMATVGSTTPFIGLFGTVVGIMTTFHDLGQTKTPSMQVVAPGISGALVATAAGLAVAIPAVIACNSFNAEIEELRETANAFIEKMMALIRANKQVSAPVRAVPATNSTPVSVAKAAPAPRLAQPQEDDDDEDADDSEDSVAAARSQPVKKSTGPAAQTGRAGA